MTDRQKSAGERRRHPRYPVSRKAKARSNGEVHHGRLKDISATGAAIHAGVRWEKDRVVELDIENMEPLEGTVARSLEDGIAIEFDLDQEDEDRLLAEMAEIRDSMRGTED